jgi:hypothetical protein
MTLKELAELKV